MPSLRQLSMNAYHLLGLDASADLKAITRRGKELVSFLRIEEHPDYPLDIEGLGNFRTDTLIKEAQERLSNPQHKVRECFFWFCNNDDIDAKAINSIESKSYTEAIKIWKDGIETCPENSFIYKKNLSVLYLILLASKSEKTHLHSAVELLYELIQVKWRQYVSFYKLYDEFNLEDKALDKAQNAVVEWAADFFTSLSQEHHDKDYLVEFQKKFSLNVGKLNTDVIQPIAERIHSYIANLQEMNISEDGFFDQEEASSLKKAIQGTQEELNKIIEIGLYKDPFIVELRDDFSSAIRSIALDLCNCLSDFGTAHKLVEIAKTISASPSLSARLSQDLVDVSAHVDQVTLITIPDSLSHFNLVVKRDFLEFQGRRIRYRDALGVSYQVTRHSTDTAYAFNLRSENEEINIGYSSFFSDGNDEKSELFYQLANLSHMLIEPIMIKKIMHCIFDLDEGFQIGNIMFSSKGFSRIADWGVPRMIEWADAVYKAHFDSGDVCLFEDSNGNSIIFERVPLSTYNAVFIPTLIEECVLRAARV